MLFRSEKKELETAIEETIEFLDSEAKEATKEDIDQAMAELESKAAPAVKKMFGGKPPKEDL